MKKQELIQKLGDIEWEDFEVKEDFSLPRNPIIAKTFRFIRFAENIGSGFHKMINGWNAKYHLKPIIEGDFDFYKITFPTKTVTSTDTVTYTVTNTVTNTITKGETKEKAMAKAAVGKLKNENGKKYK